jgi:hypothetical protein
MKVRKRKSQKKNICIIKKIGNLKVNDATPQLINLEITIQEAANILNVSKLFIKQELGKGNIPYRLIEKRKKILLKDILNYKTSINKARLDTLDMLAKDAQDLNMGY